MNTFTKRLVLVAAMFLCGGFSAFAADVPFIASPASGYAEEVVTLTWVVFVLCAFFFVLIIGLLLFFVFRYRAKTPGQEGAAIHGNTKLEILWTAIPFVIMVFLAIFSTKLVVDQFNAPEDTLIVKVTAFQFGWKFEYFESAHNGTPENSVLVSNICGNPAVFVKIRDLGVQANKLMVLPKDVNVRILVTSTDVLHSFWVPEFLIKRDTVPGMVADMWLSPNKLGTFPLVCAELCGSDHSYMTADIQVVPETEFRSWLAAEKQKQATL